MRSHRAFYVAAVTLTLISIACRFGVSYVHLGNNTRAFPWRPDSGIPHIEKGPDDCEFIDKETIYPSELPEGTSSIVQKLYSCGPEGLPDTITEQFILEDGTEVGPHAYVYNVNGKLYVYRDTLFNGWDGNEELVPIDDALQQ